MYLEPWFSMLEMVKHDPLGFNIHLSKPLGASLSIVCLPDFWVGFGEVLMDRQIQRQMAQIEKDGEKITV